MLLQINLHYKSSGAYNCPFCREPILDGEEENRKRVMERVKANDPAVMHQMGIIRFNEGDIDKAVEYLKEAAAHYQLGCILHRGSCREGLGNGHLSLGGGCHGWSSTSETLSCNYWGKNGNTERAVKHLIISANLGYAESMKEFWKHYYAGHIIKETLDATLRSHQSAIDATKSLQREVAEVIYQQMAASRR